MKDIGLVLSGGGARGIAHIGVIEALEPGVWRISGIEDEHAGQYPHSVTVIGLRELIARTFPNTRFVAAKTNK